MTKILLNRAEAAKKAAEEYKDHSPEKGLYGIEYTKISKEYLADSVNRLYQNILIYAAIESGFLKLDDLEEQLKAEMEAIQGS